MNRTKVKQSILITTMESSVVKSNHNYRTYEFRAQQNELIHAHDVSKMKMDTSQKLPMNQAPCKLNFS
jgi:hypothetical protein